MPKERTPMRKIKEESNKGTLFLEQQGDVVSMYAFRKINQVTDAIQSKA